MIITIDGPSGAGKSTLGRMLARSLNLLYIDTGAMYRAVALAILNAKVSAQDTAAVAAIAANARVTLEGDPDSLQVLLDGRDVSDQIRNEDVTHTSSVISTVPEVRRLLVERQREMGARGGGVVLEGRDIGTVVFPHADIKFFLTAGPEARAQRRYEENQTSRRDSTYEETLADINARDRRDSMRDDSPLAMAADAIVIDSTELSIEDVYERMMEEIRARHLGDAATLRRGDAAT
ncbi:MAG: CMP/dCMP kinase [Blastocatellia bacterium]|jgi:cytidylate kinase|nr:CMP/dCMP kinase [Blastocatellia bacterium]